jgi:hypothetical protein
MLLSYFDQLLFFGSNPYLSEEERQRFGKALRGLDDFTTWVQQVGNLRISSGTYLNLVNLNLLDQLPKSIQVELEARYQINCNYIRYLHTEFKAILPDLNYRLRGLKALKGVQLGLAVYPEKFFREMRDIDLLIYAEDVSVVKQILREHGYVQGVLERESCQVTPLASEVIQQAEATHYELVHFQKLLPVHDFGFEERPEQRSGRAPRFFKYRGETYCVISFDIHHNLSPDIQVNDIWKRFEPFKLDTESINGQSYEDLLWFLAARLYHETMLYNYPRLVLLQDMNAILFKSASNIDWDYIVSVAEKYDLQPSLFYTFSHLKNTFGRNIPEIVLRRLSPERANVLRYHEWGDFLPKMFGKCDTCSVEFQS